MTHFLVHFSSVKRSLFKENSVKSVPSSAECALVRKLKKNAVVTTPDGRHSALNLIEEDDLRQMGIPMGPRKKIVKALSERRQDMERDTVITDSKL